MNKSEYTILLRERLGEIIINQAALVKEDNSPENREMLIALYMIFKTVVSNENFIDELFEKSSSYYNEIDQLAKFYYTNN